MREILFRGKRIDNGEWVYGYYLKGADKISNKERHLVLTQDINVNGFPNLMGSTSFAWLVINPATVGQYTGLTDKNGKKIFEGDVVKIYDTHNLKVTFDEGCFYVEDKLVYVPAFTYDTAAYEVIGNIHDNPELMEG